MGAAGHVRRVEAGLQSVRDSKAEAGSNAVGGNNSIAEKRGKMTEQRRREIRAELARQMGWALEADGYWQSWRSLDGSTRRNVRPSYGESPIGDPFTNNADKDALVEWLNKESRPGGVIKNGLMVRDEFINHLLQVHGLSKYEVDDFFAAMTAPLETVTLAAAKALGIGEAEDD